MPLTITDTPSTVFEECSIDIVGPFCPSNSCYPYILTVQNESSKFLIAVTLEHQSAEQVERVFVDHVVLIYGIPQIILSVCKRYPITDSKAQTVVEI
jgi:hypothetical protein